MNKIWGTAEDFINLIEVGEKTLEENEIKLILLLDTLSFRMNFVSGKFLDDEDVRDRNFKEIDIRELVAKQFPSFGFYNTMLEINENIGCGETGVGDAIDDIVDIYKDLKAAILLRNKSGEEAALWQLRLDYNHHWGRHLRDLQSYIFNLEYEL